MEGFLHYEFGGLIFGGAYTWRGLFRNFMVALDQSACEKLLSCGKIWSSIHTV